MKCWHRTRTLLATACTFMALLGFVLFNSLLNKMIIEHQDDSKLSVANFHVVRTAKKPEMAKIHKPKPKKIRKVAIPMLQTLLTGKSFGMSGLEGLSGLSAGDLLGDLKDVVMTSDSVDIPPRAKHRPDLEFPESAKKRGIQGYVKLGLLINSIGKVENIKVLHSEPKGIFDFVALNNVKQWLFEAAEYKGQKVKVWASTTIRFDMN